MVAVGVRREDAHEAETQRLTVRERLSRFPGSRLRSPAADIGGVVHSIVAAEAVTTASGRQSDWLYEVGETTGRTTPLITVGGLAASITELATARPHVHPSTLGHRMRPLQEIVELRLDSP
jgi:hypothetical protein